MKFRILILIIIVNFLVYSQEVKFTIQKAHSSSIYKIDFVKENKILTTDFTGVKVLWDIETGKVIDYYTTTQQHYDYNNNDGSCFKFNQSELKEKYGETRNLDIKYYKSTTFIAKIEEDYKLSLKNLNSEFIFKTRDERGNKILTIEYSKKQKLIILGLSNGELLFLKSKNGKLIKRLKIHTDKITALRIDKNQNTLVTGSDDRSFCLIDLENLKLKKRLYGTSYPVAHIQFSENGSNLWFSDESGGISILNFENGIPTIDNYHNNNSSISYFNVKDSIFRGVNYHNKFITFDLKKDKYKQTKLVKKQSPLPILFRIKNLFLLKASETKTYQGTISKSGNFMVVKHHVYYNTETKDFMAYTFVNTKNRKTKTLRVANDNRVNGFERFNQLDYKKNKMEFYKDDLFYIKKNTLKKWVWGEKPIVFKTDVTDFVVIEDSLILFTKENGNRYLYNPITEETKHIGLFNRDGNLKYQKGFVIDHTKNELLFYKIENNIAVHKHSIKGDFNQIEVHPNKNTVATVTKLGVIKFYTLTDIENPVSFATSIYNDFAFFDDKLHYYLPKGKIDFIGVSYNNNYVFPYQFDKFFNRPDIVLSKTGLISDSYKEMLTKSISRRAKSIGEIPDFSNFPNLKVIKKIEKENKIILKYKLQNPGLKGFFICRINGVETLNSRVNIANEDTEYTIEIPKLNGKNKYEVSYINSVGIESVKQYFELDSKTNKSNLYVVSIGVSEYQQNSFNLSYAHKDAIDFNNTIVKYSKSMYDNVYSLVKKNSEVNLETTINEVSSFVSKANINDVVIIFIAGHGVLDDSLNYFFGNSDIDFYNPKNTGIPFSQIENILKKVKSNKKLLIMDTCHSGEVDKENTKLNNKNVDKEEGDLVFRKGVSDYIELNTQSTLELSKSLFFDMNNSTGANVIASASGGQYAIETNEYENGIFTYALIQGLTTKNADLNKDGEIWLDELRNYVYSQVIQLSNGSQQPTVRSENLLTNFKLR